MDQPLDGAKLKIIRAEEHLESLKREIRTYLDSRPYEMGTYTAKDGKDYPTVNTTREPPLLLSAIVGDCLCAIRAPLDYILWELAGKYFANPTRTDEDRQWVSFPIYELAHQPGFTNKINRFTNRAIPADAITEIKALQPYNRGYEPLWWLHELVNADKHRMPPLAIGTFGPFAYVEITPVGYKQPIRLFPEFGHDLDTERAPTDENMKMKARIPVFVAFKDSVVPDTTPIHEAMAQIIKTVTDIIPRFERFF